MRSTKASLDAQLALTEGAAFRPILNIKVAATYRFLCTDSRTINGIPHDGEILSISELYEGVDQLSDLTIELLDNEANRAAVKLASEVKLYLWAVDIDLYDRSLYFRGEISDPITISGGIIRFDVISYANRHDRTIGEPISADNYPGADPDVVGLIAPEIYGSHKDVPCLSIDAGGLTRLSADLLASETTEIIGSDVSAFPLTGTTIQIDSEQITYEYTIDEYSKFATLVRGVNGTTAVAHDKGAVIAEIKPYYDYLVANHPVKSLSNAKVDDVLQDGADHTFLPNDNGVAKIRFTALPKLQKSIDIEVEDTIGVSDNISVSDTIGVSSPSITPLPQDTYSTVGAGSTFPTSYGNVSTIHSDWYDYPGVATFTTYECSMLLINAKRVAVKTVNGNWLWLVGTATTDGATTSGVITATLTSNPSENRVTWSVFWGSGTSTWQRQAHIRTITGVPVYVNRSGSASKAGSATKTGTVELTGNSVAETVIGTLITCDVEGWEDDDGTITGTPNALIERPDHVALHLLRHYGDASDSDASSGQFDDFLGDRLAIRITSPRRVRELLKDIGDQVGALAHFSSGRWRFIKRIEAIINPPFDIALDEWNTISLDSGASSIGESITGLKQLKNRHTWRAGLQPNGSWLTTGKKDDVTSQDDYGLRDVVVDLPFVPDAAQAQAHIDWRSARESNPERPVITLDAILRAYKAEVGDAAIVSSVKTPVYMTGEIISIRYNHAGRIRLTVEAAV